MEEIKKKNVAKKTTTKKTNTKAKKEELKEEVATGGFTPEQMAQMQQMMGMMFQTFMQNMGQVQQVETVKEEKVNKKIANKSVKKNKSTLRRDRGEEDVLVKSVAGTVTFKSPKTGVTYSWLDAGDEEWLSVDEVLQMETKSKKFLHEPWLMVMDDEINEILGLKEVTEIVSELEDIDNILEEYTVAEIEEILSKSSKGYRDTFSGIIMNKILNDELKDGILIRELGRILEVDFDLYKQQISNYKNI